MRPIAILALLATIAPPHALAGCPPVRRVRQKVVAVQSYVAYQQPVVLQYAQPAAYYTVGSRLQEEAVADRIAQLVLQRLQAPQQAEQVQASPSLVEQHCASCHSGEGAKKGFRVDVEMTPDARLLGIERVMHDNEADRMPKGTALDPETLGLVIQELAGGAE